MEAAGEERRAPAAFVAAVGPEAGGTAVLPERLQRREAERQRGVARQRELKEAQAVREEGSEFFAAAFGREREAVEALLAAGRPEEAAERLQGLRKLLTESVRFLAPYEVRQGQEAVSRLQAELELDCVRLPSAIRKITSCYFQVSLEWFIPED
uniref:Tubulin-specific chaperone C N-terminal domain-containing protein n=1 Tax=Coturnix japonica TaxID=93934 RepID=A0A8C2T7I6_COTJA